VLTELGASDAPPFDQWADVSFVIVQRAVTTPELRAYMGSVALELLEEVDGRTG
jgi:hypothetical protein